LVCSHFSKYSISDIAFAVHLLSQFTRFRRPPGRRENRRLNRGGKTKVIDPVKSPNADAKKLGID